MRIKARIWAGAAGVLGVFAIAAWLLPEMLGMAGTRAWILRVGLLVFGTAAAVLSWFYLRARARRSPLPEVDDDEDIDQVVAAAEARLAASDQTTESRLSRLPVGLVLGPRGSTKSSILTHSGLNPELLAGEVERGDAVVPTDPANIWYAQGTVLVEAGGRLLDNETRWRRLIRQLLPSRLAAALGRGRLAPRFAVLCIACDEFLNPGATHSLPVTARQLRARLGDVSQQLGVRLPVYVLFTRADRVPFFIDYVRSFTSEEAEQVLGVTLPLHGDTGGTWAEGESPRLNDAFGRIVHALAVGRLDVLARDVEPELRGQAYEFPRELRKIVEPAVQFLLDVFRPSQLGVNPFVRGVYLTGVRPVLLRNAAVEQRTTPVQPRGVDAGATIVFDPVMLHQATTGQAATPPTAGGRRIPQWVFLHRLFRDVVFRDEAVPKITGGGTRVELLRRGLIATAAAACLVIALGFTISYAGNRRMVGDAITATREALDVGNIPGPRSEQDLEKLDALRTLAATLSRHERSGRPIRLGWGLYSGAAMQPLLHRVYFDRFAVMLWDDTRERLTRHLRALPSRPDENSDFGKAQDALAAHLLTTSEHRRSTPDLLAPALMSFWPDDDASDRARWLAHRQFRFFAGELRYGNPYGTTADAALVERSQRFLRAFGADAYYRALIAEASSAAPDVRYTGPGVVSNDVVVPGAFTRAGWSNVQANLDSVDQVFARYRWIYGDRPVADKPRRSDLAAMYEGEYISRWQDYLARATVERFTNLSEAASRMPVLGATSSPLFAMLATASRETAFDTTTRVGRAFQPLHATVSPNAEPTALTASVAGYTNALTALGSRLNLLARAAGAARDELALQATADVSEVRAQAGAIATAFTMRGDAAVTGNNIQRLLRQPADYIEALVSGLDVADLNASAASFCRSFNPLARSFPFTAQGADAAVDDVNAVFQKPGGTLWAFYHDALEPHLTEQGRPKPNARVRAGFERFFRTAVEFSNTLYRTSTATIAFEFQPDIPAGASQVILAAGGSPVTFTPTSRTTQSFEWYADRHREARLVAVLDGTSVVVAEADGPWAVFQLFHAAEWSGSTSPYRVEWRIPGSAAGVVVASVSFETGAPPFLRPGYLSPLAQCVPRVQ